MQCDKLVGKIRQGMVNEKQSVEKSSQTFTLFMF